MGNTGTKKSRTGIPVFLVPVNRYEIYRYGPAKVSGLQGLGKLSKELEVLELNLSHCKGLATVDGLQGLG